MNEPHDPAIETLRTSPRVVVFNWVKIASLLTAIVVMVSVLSFALGQTVSTINNRLDRNCRLLATILADNRFLIIEHSGNKPEAAAFREIFRQSLVENCGRASG